ncbi:MAG: hypothetical protein IPM69_12965 [Ignavibacteria bacterium]|nr:hypothetical protein [Ignavibacteria bacterium]
MKVFGWNMTFLMRIISVLLYFAFVDATAKQHDTLSNSKAKINKTVSAYIGSKFNLGDSEFFREYARTFNANTLFPVQTVIGVEIRAEAIKSIRFGINSEYFAADFVDSYSRLVQSPVDSLSVGARFSSEKIHFTAIPIMLTADYVPSNTQFRTYCGGGLGISISRIRWEETTISTVANDRRVGGTHIDENILAPTACIYAGLELGFDKRHKNNSVTSLTIEARYSIIGMSAPMFASVSSQFFNPPDTWKQKFSVGASGFSLTIGLAFQSPDI